MHVIATAGHVDHGKSALVRALTGMDPDRWAEERRRGLTIDLGFAWTDIDGRPTAFVDVPGHERFVTNMLAGVGAVPAVLFVVAADEGWMPQSAEHLAALDALQVRYGVLAVTRCDLAEPAPARAAALAEIARTSLRSVPSVAVSSLTGEGIGALRRAIADMTAALPAPSHDAPVRLWIDRSFTISGAGTVVTGTLVAGTLRVGEPLLLEPQGIVVHVRGLHSMGQSRDAVIGVSRVAVNVRGVDHHVIRRGDALVTPHAWTTTALLDVRLNRADNERLPRNATLHLGSAAIAAHVRELGPQHARLTLDRAVPAHVLDRGLLREPGLHRVIAGVTVLDVQPPAMAIRHGVVTRAAQLAEMSEPLVGADEVRRRGMIRVRDLIAMGFPPPQEEATAGWLIDPGRLADLATELRVAVEEWASAHPLDPGMPAEAARQRLRLPDGVQLERIRAAAGIEFRDGRLISLSTTELPARVRAAVDEIVRGLARRPFAAPEAAELAALGLGAREIAAATRAGALIRLTDAVVLAPDAEDQAVAVLARIPQPFTVSAARQALDTTRRVAVPLLEFLDRRGRTERLADDRRRVMTTPASSRGVTPREQVGAGA